MNGDGQYQSAVVNGGDAAGYIYISSNFGTGDEKNNYFFIHLDKKQ
jgi:hypothetical protein